MKSYASDPDSKWTYIYQHLQVHCKYFYTTNVRYICSHSQQGQLHWKIRWKLYLSCTSVSMLILPCIYSTLISNCLKYLYTINKRLKKLSKYMNVNVILYKHRLSLKNLWVRLCKYPMQTAIDLKIWSAFILSTVPPFSCSEWNRVQGTHFWRGSNALSDVQKKTIIKIFFDIWHLKLNKNLWLFWNQLLFSQRPLMWSVWLFYIPLYIPV